MPEARCLKSKKIRFVKAVGVDRDMTGVYRQLTLTVGRSLARAEFAQFTEPKRCRL